MGQKKFAANHAEADQMRLMYDDIQALIQDQQPEKVMLRRMPIGAKINGKVLSPAFNTLAVESLVLTICGMNEVPVQRVRSQHEQAVLPSLKTTKLADAVQVAFVDTSMLTNDAKRKAAVATLIP